MDYQRKTLPAQPYLYIARETGYDGAEIAEAMGSAFGALAEFTGERGIERENMPMTIYLEMPVEQLRFRCAVAVSDADAAWAEGGIMADTLPAGDVIIATHLGPYSRLGRTHRALWDQLDRDGIARAGPVWEVYIDDPGTTPEPELRTLIHYLLA